MLLYLYSDVACDVLEDELILSAEEDAENSEFNFSRLVSCSKEFYLGILLSLLYLCCLDLIN